MISSFGKDTSIIEDKINLEIYIYGRYCLMMDVLIGAENFEIYKIESKYDNKSDYNIINIESESKKISNISDNNLSENFIEKSENDEKKKDKIIPSNIDKYLENLEIHEKDLKAKNNFIIKNASFNNWNMHFYCKDNQFNENSIKEIKDNIYNNYDKNIKNSVIIFVDEIKEIYDVIDIFSKINKEFHPLFLFIINENSNKIEENNKDENIDKILADINKYIVEKQINMFNIRNIEIIKETNLNERKDINYEEIQNNKFLYILKVYQFLINSMYYYNNLGDNDSFENMMNNSNYFLKEINNKKINIKNQDKNIGLFNILLLGRPGVGKSTLINILSGRKRSKEGKGLLTTKKIIQYVLYKYNISLYDSPGFGLDSDIKKIIELIEKLNMNLLESKNQIHLIFYLISGVRDFYDIEINILKVLKKINIPIFFLLTFCKNLEEGEERKEVIDRNLKGIYYEMDPIDGLKYYKEQTRILPVHLLNEVENSFNNFGLKNVLEEVYKKFKHCIIYEEDINKIKEYIKQTKKIEGKIIFEKKKEIIDILNKNQNHLYKYINNINNIIETAKINAESTISYYSLEGGFLGIFGFFTSYFLKNIRANLLLNLADNYKKVINDNDKEKLIQNNTENIMENKIQQNIPLFSSIANYKNIRDFGNYYMEKFNKELEEKGIEGMGQYLFHLINCYNQSINGFLELSKNFN